MQTKQIAMKVSLVSIIINFILSAFKLAAGLIANSGALVSDAVHSASDVFSTFIVMIGIKLADKKPDKNHEYGHERIECVAAIILAFVLAATGIGIAADAINKIQTGINGDLAVPGVLALVAAGVSIIVKEVMFRYTKHYAKKINSGAMMADAWHHRSDALSSVGSLIGVGDSVFINNCNTEGQINIIECYGTDIITGGIIGYYITDRQVSANISNCKTEIEIYGDSYYEAGGFIGCVDINTRTSLSIVNCAVYGNIQIGTVGGFICRGFSYGELNIENCYVKNQITAYSRAAGFLERFTGNNNCKLNNCYAECKIITHRLGEPNIVAGESGGFSYQVSGINFIGCYSIFDINTLRGGGFSYYLSDCVLERCYSEGEFGLFNMKLNGLFTRGLIHTELWNCYIKSNINELQDKENIFVFTFLRNSYVTNFYYVGSDINNVLFRIENSDINNFHLLRSSSQEFNYVSQIIGEAPSTLDISVYVKPEDMYFLADKLNEGQDEEVWINVMHNYPKLINRTNSKML